MITLTVDILVVWNTRIHKPQICFSLYSFPDGDLHNLKALPSQRLVSSFILNNFLTRFNICHWTLLILFNIFKLYLLFYLHTHYLSSGFHGYWIVTTNSKLFVLLCSVLFSGIQPTLCWEWVSLKHKFNHFTLVPKNIG